jgi:hypothetical protein
VFGPRGLGARARPGHNAPPPPPPAPAPAPQVGGKAARASLLATQPFGDTFGPQRRRKRPKLAAEGLEALVAKAEGAQEGFESKAAGVGGGGDVFDDMKDAVRLRPEWLCRERGAAGRKGRPRRPPATPPGLPPAARSPPPARRRPLAAARSPPPSRPSTSLSPPPPRRATRCLRRASPSASGASCTRCWTRRTWSSRWGAGLPHGLPWTSPLHAWIAACCGTQQAAGPARLTRPLSPAAAPPSRPKKVLDARDPEGTRCRFIERHIRKNARHKHLLLLLNKCDLVRPPKGGRQGWVFRGSSRSARARGRAACCLCGAVCVGAVCCGAARRCARPRAQKRNADDTQFVRTIRRPRPLKNNHLVESR